MSYFAQQSLEVLNPDLTVIEKLNKISPNGLGTLRTLVRVFQASSGNLDKNIGCALSGGEKSRLAIVRMLYKRSGVPGAR